MEEKEVTTYITLPVTVVVDSWPGTTAYFKDFPGLIAEGNTPDEAVENLKEILTRFIIEEGIKLSPPMTFDELKKQLE